MAAPLEMEKSAPAVEECVTGLERSMYESVTVRIPKEDLWKVRVGEETALSITGRVVGLRLLRNGSVSVDLDSLKVL
jgi:hypothetical protein